MMATANGAPPSVSAFLHPFARPAAESSSFVRIVGGKGARVWDDQGNTYIDAMASLWYCAVGHGRPEMAEAIARQAGTLGGYQCFDRFTNEPADALAERIASIAPETGSRVFFTAGGSEAVDTALKLVRLAHVLRGDPGRTIVISRAPSYHGSAYGSTALTGLPPNQLGFGPGVPDVVQVPKDDSEAVRAIFEQHAGRVAAVYAEPIIGAAGVYPPHPGYLQELRRLCDEHGACLVLDEVITGFGRLGQWFAGQFYGVRADLTTFAKAVTSGYIPLGGVIVAPSVHEVLAADPAFILRHGFTYSGHPTACAAGLACLDIIERESLLSRPSVIGNALRPGLEALVSDGVVASFRGEMGVWAVELHPGQDVAAARDRLLDAGIVVRPIPPATIAMCPPFVIGADELDQILAALRSALA